MTNQENATQIRLWQAIALLAIVALVIVLIMKLPFGQRREVDVPRAVSLPPVGYEVVSFDDLPGWGIDNHAQAFAPFLRSCEALLTQPDAAPANPVEYIAEDKPFSFGGTVGDWRGPCLSAAALMTAGSVDLDMARRFFEENFLPIRIVQPDLSVEAKPVMTDQGLFTGYFEPIFPASPAPTPKFTMPVLGRPADLVTVDLGRFRPELAGTRIAGQVQGGVLVPYATHAEINDNPPTAEILGWMDPNDLLFMQIQGSGRLSIDGKDLRLGYAAPNGHAYTAIGRELVEMGEIPLEEITMQSIYEWLEAAPPEEARRVREVNESYIFFRPLTGLQDPALGPLGSQGVQLTAGRSLAVDRRYHAMGAPVWVDLEADEENPYPMKRLFIAQDTGGAIRGPVRGDIFIGSGADAGGEAGRMRRTGMLYTLLPRTVVGRLENDAAQEAPDA